MVTTGAEAPTKPGMRVFVILAGTNIGAQPMSAFKVREYGLALDRTLEACDARLFSRGRLEDNEYTHDDGMKINESSLVRAGELPAANVRTLRLALICTAAEFHQEAIGLVVHEADMPSIVRADDESAGTKGEAEAA